MEKRRKGAPNIHAPVWYSVHIDVYNTVMTILIYMFQERKWKSKFSLWMIMRTVMTVSTEMYW